MENRHGHVRTGARLRARRSNGDVSMPLTNDEIKALLDAMKALAGARDRQIPGD